MASAKQQENLLLTEHFTWPPISLIDDIINAVNEVLYRCTDTFEQGLSSADPALLGFADRYAAENRTPEKDDDGSNSFPEAKLEIEEGVLKLETLMENAVDKNFDKLEIWTLRNVLCLPRGEEELGRWVRLGHYENLQIPPKDSQLTPEALYALRRKLVETQKLNTALVAEKKRNEAQIARLRSLLQPTVAPKLETSPNGHSEQTPASFAFLTHTPAAQSLGIQPLPQTSNTTSTTTQPLTTHTTFTTSQLPYLRQLLEGLQPHLATTSLPSTGKQGETEELARERRVYVESQSKRILEKRGVDTRDGVEGIFEGTRVRSDEVRGLESVVGAMAWGRKVDGVKKEDDEVKIENGDGDGSEDAEGEAMDTS
ncbi:Mis12-domain-containing protein [Dothidotthia symphoricarpi CBS 119687]|uniref:Mis12-domain-containing protein n=1 Tax=Dothidotthia symphoricarpi CBS 119687 TaxID=1392245 RepID=A0A6A5ZYS9_9PLEO|nr:Mis12-domain-containing protein [Dothidotthia symphoricarpi CBS 119687]KAF2124709.1 Mis12-domain-containing protein [Dothidotthia symphoricarpi CBS 119687]